MKHKCPRCPNLTIKMVCNECFADFKALMNAKPGIALGRFLYRQLEDECD